MEGLNVRNDHINADSWWKSDHGGQGWEEVALWIIYDDVVLYEIFMYVDINLAPKLEALGMRYLHKRGDRLVISENRLDDGNKI